MRIIVTGADGFIGTHLVQKLEEQGNWVYKMDKKRGLDMFSSLPRVDIIYHLACINQQQALSCQELNLRVNAYGAKYLTEAALRMNVPLIYTSTASVYGQARTIATPVDAELDPKTDYAVAKLAGEYFIRNSGCKYQIYRLSNVYGPGQTLDNPYCGVIGKFITYALDEKILPVVGDGSQTRDYTYIDDVISVLTNPIISNTIQNVSHSSEISVLDLISTLESVIGRELTTESIPNRGIDGISRRRLITNYYCPTELSDGLEKTVEWFRDS